MKWKIIQDRRTRSWTESKMKAALEAVKAGCSYIDVARAYGIPTNTLFCYVHKLLDVSELPSEFLVLNREQEEELVHRVIDAIRSTNELNRTLIRQMAFRIAEEYSLYHRWKKGMAAKLWLCSFLQRHPEIEAFHEALFGSDPILPAQIWNGDESGYWTGSDGGSVVFASTPQTQPSPVVPPVAAAPSPVQASVPRKSDFPPTTGLPLSNGPLAGLAGSASPVQVPPGAANAGGGPAPPAPSPAPAALPPPSLPPPYPATPMQVSRDFLFCYGN
ncbi:uncharacterized protein LOC134284812 isoform X1 [Aedes albopictus]|uniref:HTH psq-type domain-containing protein n=1 Tax=Aedes albopictus TaxID=7160 RepID=A0ABM1YTU1_AEDAL